MLFKTKIIVQTQQQIVKLKIEPGYATSQCDALTFRPTRQRVMRDADELIKYQNFMHGNSFKQSYFREF